ncbi:tRNA glutamyl-Q(34) synthetase GluQRS [Thioalkalivibrio sp. XN279]|nr:tRNA glutamyl-Q(34) synthetase GluQRS [Thioalkalivibrio sp. XN279]
MATSADGPDRPGTPAASAAGVYRGRFAPSPTGPLHFGSLLAAAGSWLDARAAGGRWLLRIEDIDPPREPPGAADEILRTLEAFELHWDETVLYQGRRREAFDAALLALRDAGWVYPCGCSRKDIEAANRALGRTGARTYPGTCRSGVQAPRRSRVLRVRTTPEPTGMHDRLQGAFQQQLELEVGDFVVRRREGYIAYQLAVVVDDAAQGVTDVVRGVDLLDSTPRQLWLQRLLGLPVPRYMHLPVVAAPDGQKLSKQTGAEALDPRRAGVLAWRVLQCLAQAPPPELKGAPPGELWAWGAAHWRPQQLAGSRSIPLPPRL